MNKYRTQSNDDTSLTQAGSSPVLYELVDKDGKVRGRYRTLKRAFRAGLKAEDRGLGEQRDDAVQGWDLRVAGCDG
jgi:hypothetical protein